MTPAPGDTPGASWAGQDETPDTTWPPLGVGDADAVRLLARGAFADLGLDVTIEGGDAVDPTGRHFTLDAIARSCRVDERGRTAWPEIVREGVTGLVDALDTSPFDGRDAASLLASTYSRVVSADDVTSGGLGYARTVAPGLVEVLNLDLPESVAFFGDDAVREHGPIDDLWRAGRVNLRGVEPEERQTLEREGGRVEVLFSDSMFLASTVLQLDEVVARETGREPDPDLGVLVTLPHRHQLAFHVVGDDTLLPSLALLAKFGAVGHTDSLGPISPDVYWWHHGRLDRLTTIEGERIQVDADVEFTRVVEQVTGERGA
ncbi:hypothetical protein V3N99_11890 [Dermatophilaceae bacterium Soc4.6]